MDYGLDHFKFFPAEAAGGIPMLKAIAGPFPQATFCPTGGITPDNYNAYLLLPNVAWVGCYWLAPQTVINEKTGQKSRNWQNKPWRISFGFNIFQALC
ncbi:hypothetical protein [Methyloglobulus sp.]|uniref:hypothetical protein n=1 Tax=Methyloglobulus sp. TaxID=2518622 RepID=UPI003989F56B